MVTTSEYRAARGTAFQQREMDIKTKIRILMKEMKKHNVFYSSVFSITMYLLPPKEERLHHKQLEFRSEDFNSHL